MASKAEARRALYDALAETWIYPADLRTWDDFWS